MARPNPRAAPVTRATCPSRPNEGRTSTACELTLLERALPVLGFDDPDASRADEVADVRSLPVRSHADVVPTVEGVRQHRHEVSDRRLAEESEEPAVRAGPPSPRDEGMDERGHNHDALHRKLNHPALGGGDPQGERPQAAGSDCNRAGAHRPAKVVVACLVCLEDGLCWCGGTGHLASAKGRDSRNQCPMGDGDVTSYRCLLSLQSHRHPGQLRPCLHDEVRLPARWAAPGARGLSARLARLPLKVRLTSNARGRLPVRPSRRRNAKGESGCTNCGAPP